MIYHWQFVGTLEYYVVGRVSGGLADAGIWCIGVMGSASFTGRDCSLQYHSYLYQEGGGLSYGDFNSLKIMIVGRDNIMTYSVTPPGIFIDGYLAVTWLPINGSSQTILNIIGILSVLKVYVLVIIGLQFVIVDFILI